MYKVILGNAMYDDTYEFVFSDYDKTINFIKTVLDNGHQITIEKENMENVKL